MDIFFERLKASDLIARAFSISQALFKNSFLKYISLQMATFPSNDILWQYDEIRQEIIVMPKPKSFSDKLWGLGKDVWEKETADDYIRKERTEW
jgi:hypothetical protein